MRVTRILCCVVSAESTIDTNSRTVEALIEAMRRGMADAPDIYKPGAFWDQLIEANLNMLRCGGIANLKRTVSNNYYNWLVTEHRDPQLQRAVKNWLKQPSLGPFVNRVENPVSELRNLSRDRPFALPRANRWVYKFFVGAIWETTRRGDTFGLTERLSEPTVGNPIRIRNRGRPISQDLANSITELTYVGRSGVLHAECRVAELGAGYGRLAYVYAEAFPLTYCIFDIPPALAVAQWYLTEVLGAERIVPYAAGSDFGAVEPKLKPGVVAFFTPDQMQMFPEGWFDCTQSISTLPEMPHAQARHYLKLLAAKSGGAVFLKQWRQWRNQADGVELREQDYVLPAPWRLIQRRADPIQPLFFNQLWFHE
jgi:putative sugar O-methyltransferase